MEVGRVGPPGQCVRCAGGQGAHSQYRGPSCWDEIRDQALSLRKGTSKTGRNEVSGR